MLNTQTHRISGPAGTLQMRITQPDSVCQSISQGISQRTGILCHPHPLYGGSMDDRVLDICAKTMLELGMTTVRFNFRGVGTSAGVSGRTTEQERQLQTYNPPEVGDLYAVIDNLVEEPGAGMPVFVGYSFGAHVLWQSLNGLADRNLRNSTVILIAPPTGSMRFQNIIPASNIRLHGIWCEDDDYVNPSWFADQPALATHPIPGGDHFFSNQAPALSAAVGGILATIQD